MQTRQTAASSGQIGVIILLIMVVLVTIGLSLAARTTQESNIAIQQQSSTRVFNAAEVGVEQALSQILIAEEAGELESLPTNPVLVSLAGSNSNINYTITPDDMLETYIDQGVAVELPLNGTPGNLQVSWDHRVCPNSAAMLITVYTDVSGEMRSIHYAIDGCGRGGFSLPNSSGGDYEFGHTITLTANDRLVRVTPIYNHTELQVTGSMLSNSQYTVLSQAQSALGEKETKAIEVTRTRLSAPTAFDFALVSGGSISKP